LGLIKLLTVFYDNTDCKFHLLHLIRLSATCVRTPLNQSFTNRNNKIFSRYIFSFLDSPSGPGTHCRGFTNTLRHHTFVSTPLDEWSARKQRTLPDNTQHSQQTDIRAPDGIRASSPNNLSAV